METLNRFATEYAGLLATVGLALTVLFGGAAVYFYYNPKRATYRLSYKNFGGRLFGRRLRFSGEKMEGNTFFSAYVDIWNSGAEPVSHDVIRRQVSISLQTGLTNRGVTISSAEILSETHPGLSKFAVEMHDERIGLNWQHFDPGMGVRIKLLTTAPVGSDQIAVFGEGLRLNFKRIRQLSEIGGVLSLLQKFFILGVPVALVLSAGGPALAWVSHQNLSGAVSYLAFVAVALAVVAGLVGGGFLAFGINTVIERVFNTRSPIEDSEGVPSSEFSSSMNLGAQDLDREALLIQSQIEHYEEMLAQRIAARGDPET